MNKISIAGLSDLKKDLKKLPVLMQAKILRNANRKAARLKVEQKLIAAVPFKSKKSKRRSKKKPFTTLNEKQAITTNERGSKTAVRSGISGKYFHYRFTEFGTKRRKTKSSKFVSWKYDGKRGQNRKKTKPMNRGIMPVTRPFANRIIDRSINPLFRYLKTEYSKGVAKILKKKT